MFLRWNKDRRGSPQEDTRTGAGTVCSLSFCSTQFLNAPSRRQWRVRQWRVNEEESIPLATRQQIPSICVVRDGRTRHTSSEGRWSLSTRRGGYGPGVAEGGLGRDAFGPKGGKGYPAGRAGGCPRSAEGARFRLNIGETSVTSRRSFREDFDRARFTIISIASRTFVTSSSGKLHA